MSSITCSIIKQYMWYHNKFKKRDGSSFLIVLFFKCTSMYCTIYENLSKLNITNEKKHYSTTPTEHVFDKNTYHSFPFYKINEKVIIDNLRNVYDIIYIDVDLNKTWTERPNRLEKFHKNTFIANIFSKITDFLYEPLEDVLPNVIVGSLANTLVNVDEEN